MRKIFFPCFVNFDEKSNIYLVVFVSIQNKFAFFSATPSVSKTIFVSQVPQLTIATMKLQNAEWHSKKNHFFIAKQTQILNGFLLLILLFVSKANEICHSYPVSEDFKTEYLVNSKSWKRCQPAFGDPVLSKYIITRLKSQHKDANRTNFELFQVTKIIFPPFKSSEVEKWLEWTLLIGYSKSQKIVELIVIIHNEISTCCLKLNLVKLIGLFQKNLILNYSLALIKWKS